MGSSKRRNRAETRPIRLRRRARRRWRNRPAVRCGISGERRNRKAKAEVSFVVLLDILSVVLAVVSSVVLLAATALSASSTASSAAVGIVLSVLCCFIAIHRSRSRESKPQIAIAPAFCNSKLDRAATKAGKASKNGWNMRGMGARRTRNAGRIGGRRAETSASRNKIAAYPTFDFQEVFRLHTEV